MCVFQLGYEKYSLMRGDPGLCFLARCGPPDGAALLSEQDNEDDIRSVDRFHLLIDCETVLGIRWLIDWLADFWLAG